MKHYILLLSMMLSAPLALMAQNAVTTEEHQLTTVNNPWLQTDNAAGLGRSTYSDHAMASIGVETFGGDYHRAQEGNRVNKLDFFAESYTHLSKNWIAWGSFRFNMMREKERAWSDVIDTYESSPYIFGSSVKGSYDTQMFDLHIKLARTTKGIATFGATVDYKVADVSRQRDPRSRTQLADYTLRPSILFALGAHSDIGVTGAYRWKKEKLPNVTTVQEDPNILYYTMLGMEQASATAAGFKGFQRQFVSAYWGGDIQYRMHCASNQLLLSVGALFENQKIEEEIKHSPGSFKAYHLNADVYFNHQSDKTLLAVTWKNYYKKGHANENLQELVTTRDATTGITSQEWVTLYTYNERYRTINYHSDLDISLRNSARNSNDYGWLVALKGRINGFQQAYSMPTSTNNVKMAMVGLKGSIRLFKKNDMSLRLTAHADYGFNLKNDLKLAASSLKALSLSSTSYEIGSYNYATNVIEVDKAHFDAHYTQVGAEAQFNFPISIKNSKLNSFVKAYCSSLHANQGMGNWNGGGIAFGVIL